MSESNNESSYRDYGLSSRVKEIFVELHEYRFFHKPSEVSKIDGRFIGREKIANKLKAILTKNETRSGAYLVTGYRGMGKSSFVSKVIDEVDPTKEKSIRFSQYLRILAILFLLSLVNFERGGRYDLFLIAVPIVLILFIFFMFLRVTDKCNNQLGISEIGNGKNKGSEVGWSLGDIFKWTFVIPDRIDSDDVFRGQLRIIYLALWIHVLGRIWGNFGDVDYHFPLYLILWLVLIGLGKIIESSPKDKTEKSQSSFTTKEQKQRSKNNISPLLETILKPLKIFFNYSRRVYIRINLGYEKLREVDILRLIARSIQEHYESPRRKGFWHYFYKFAIFMLLFIIVGTLYYSGPIYDLNQNFKRETELFKYFPSQNIYFLENFEKIVDERKKSKQDPTTILKRFFIPGNVPKNFIVSVDIFVFASYRKIRKLLEPFKIFDLPIHGIFGLSNTQFKFLPETLDYLFIFHLLVFYLAWRYIIPRFFRVPPYGVLKRKIRKLNEMVDYEITDEAGGNAGITSSFLFNIFRKKQRRQPRADIREIEKNLISILEDFDKYSRFSMKPEFIFIFDELDKIEPNSNIDDPDRDKNMNIDQPETTYFSTEGVRKRQHTIFKILSNLKHFLNTAKAKFIFIAGREMYDAALADVSDRNFFIGSIFHDVIYVNSFFTDNSGNQSSGFLAMTEKYVCQFLFPPFLDVKKEDCNLERYSRYLDEFFPKGKYHLEIWERRQKIEKILFTLRQFITFLAYRSNGAPKKLTSYFERYVHKPGDTFMRPDGQPGKDQEICVGLSRENLYLRFRYHDQYKFGMITYLVNPVMLSVGKTIKNYGDKLLMSISFLVDHLYKFHTNAYAWRTIELTPEIMDINKSPQLRGLISTIKHTLANSHLKWIVSGLYDYKFRKRISEEISFLSKISETEAAAFNFSLDESLSLKSHYKKLLDELKASYRTVSGEHRAEFIRSVSFIHMILGDFHFYDDDYNDAIIQYMEAVQYLKKVDFKPTNASLFLLLVRNMLKLGLSLEKRKSYSSAFMIYSQLSTIIVNFKDIDLKEIGLKETLADSKDLKKYIGENSSMIVGFDKKKLKDGKPKVVLVEDHDDKDGNKLDGFLHFEAFKSKIHDHKPVSLSEDFIKLMMNEDAPFTPKKEEILAKLTYLERLKLVYQPLLAKLQINEKTHARGICLTDLKLVELEFDFITRSIRTVGRFLFTSEFWVRVGDILYYKNGLLPANLLNDNEKDQSGETPDIHYCDRKGDTNRQPLCSENKKARDIVKKGYNLPCRACHYYMKSFSILCRDFLLIKELGSPKMRENLLLKELYVRLRDNKLSTRNATAMKVMANTLSCIGDTFYSCSTKEPNPDYDFLAPYLDFVAKPNENPENPHDNNEKTEALFNLGRKFSKMEEVVIYYYLSFRFYLLAGQHKDASDQLLKILYWFRNLVLPEEGQRLESEENMQKLLEQIEEGILRKAIKILYRAYGNIHRLEIEDYESIFSTFAWEEFNPANNISLSADLREFVGAFLETKLAWGQKGHIAKSDSTNIQKYCFATPFSMFNRMYNRIIDLRLKTKINYIIFQEFKFDEFLRFLSFAYNKKNPKKGGSSDEKPEQKKFTRLFEEFKRKKMDLNRGTWQKIWELVSGDNGELKKKIEDFSLKVIKSRDVKLGVTTTLPFEEVFIEMIEFLITDSIYCNHEIIKLQNIYGTSYMGYFPVIAYTHKYMAKWCEYYLIYKTVCDDGRGERLDKELKLLVGADNLRTLNPEYHFEKSREAFYSVKELHSEGKAYKEIIQKMYYLNDDFNDTIGHFFAGGERYLINAGNIDNALDKVREKVKRSDIYKLNNYLEEEIPQ